jgi:hypothetical protein
MRRSIDEMTTRWTGWETQKWTGIGTKRERDKDADINVTLVYVINYQKSWIELSY